jgi:hypothetical protein
MHNDGDLSDTELIQEAMACSVRQRFLLELVERRAAHRELDARLRREARQRKKKGGGADHTTPEYDPAA